MRMTGLVIGMLLAAVTAHAARALYINDVIQVTLRAGPGYDHRVITVLRSGDRVEVLEEGGEWSRVRAGEGGEGWVLTRLLTDTTPNALKLRQLERELAALKRSSSGQPAEELAALLDEKLKLESTLAEVRFELDAARQAYEALEKQAAGDPELNQALASTRKQLAQKTGELDQCRRLAAEAGRERTIRWFLAGAMVLLAGLLIGLAMARRRTSKLY